VLDVAQRDAVLHQRLFKGEGATEHEGDEIVAPVRHDIGRLVHDLAVAPDAIARHVGADVEVEPERGNAGVADFGHADDRARFGIELAEAMEGAGEFLRQDGEIALNEAVGDVRGGDGFPGPEIPSRLFARKHRLRPHRFAALP
jgi:hypothetical protein